MGPFARALYAYWLDLHPDDTTLPGRRHFDPVDLARRHPQILPNLWLVDVEREPLRFRYRLVGGALVDAGAVARVGRYVDRTVDLARPGNLNEALSGVARDRQPSHRKGPPNMPHDRHVSRLERLSLPMAADGRTVDLILSITVYDWQKGYEK